MDKIACQYAIARFAPYVETGEFANVGILMLAPRLGYFGFKLETRYYRRITRFFEELEPKLYRETLQTLREELQRIRQLLKAHGFDVRKQVNDTDFARQIFSEVVRPRESIMRFSEPRVVLADEPEDKLRDLFEFYVERNFITREYKETVLEKKVRTWLGQAQIARCFQRMTVGDDQYHAVFPFVETVDNRPVKIIKPLHLAQDRPNKITDHGGTWLFRLNELRRRDKLPERVLFAVAGPGHADARRYQAFEEIAGRLAEAGVEVTDYGNRERVIEFARIQ